MKTIREELIKAFQPVLDSIVDTSLKYYEDIYLKLPDTMSEEDKMNTIKSTIDSTAQVMINGMKELRPQEVKDGR